MSSLGDLVKDWNGFEKLIADMNNDGTVSATHNVKLKGKDGVDRQIDVLIVHRQGLYEHRILGECKYWKHEIKRSHVDAMISAMSDLGASKGVFFTTKGYQSGAKVVASKNNVDLFLVREPTDEEWGLPGRNVHFLVQILCRSILSMKFPNPMMALIFDSSQYKGPTLNVNIVLGSPERRSHTKTTRADGSAGKDLEDLIDDGSRKFLDNIAAKEFIINGGASETRYIQSDVNLSFESMVYLPVPGGRVEVPNLRLTMGVRVAQIEIKMDRMDSFAYALVVEDCVNHRRFTSSRRHQEGIAELQPIEKRSSESGERPIENGSVVRVVTGVWFDPKEMDGLQPVVTKIT